MIFVHGCFWHRHSGCRMAYTPKSNVEFWQHKLQGNVARDARNQALLMEQGWRVIVIWECETRDREALREQLARWLKLEVQAEKHGLMASGIAGPPTKLPPQV